MKARALALAAVLAAAPAASQQRPLTVADVVELTLSHSPQIAMGALDVEAQQAAHQQAASPFDARARASLSRARERTPLFPSGEDGPTSVLGHSLDYETGVDWLTRSGVVLSPSLRFRGTDASTAPGVVRNTGTAGLELAVPLLRGRGGGVAVASERAAWLGVEASRAELERIRSDQVLAAVEAYWEYVGAVERLAVLVEAAARARTLVEQTRTLVEADQRPALDSLSVLANAASREGARLAGESTVILARQRLALATGVPLGRLELLAAPADRFPAIPAADAVAAWPADSVWVAQALDRRADLAAARTRSTAAHALLGGLRNDTRSRLDVVGGLGYTGIQLGSDPARFLGPISGDQRGAHVTLGLSYEVPLRNAAARGQLLRGTATARRSAIVADETARSIGLGVVAAVQVLRRVVEEARLVEKAVHLWDAQVVGERERFQLGTSTLFDVLQAEDRRIGARVEWIGIRVRYAAAVADLCHQRGALAGGAACATAAPSPH